jgi:hypothetical protein
MAPPLLEVEQTTAPSPSTPDPAAPQQSEFSRHKSPSTRQPRAGWQMLTPVGPYGAQRRLQHCPHPPPGQIVPSTAVQLTDPLLGWLQTPGLLAVTAWLLGVVQIPPQQSFAW